jgi:ankyrin repeat protein
MGDNEIELTALVENGEKEQVRNRVRSRAGKLNIDTPRDGDGRTPLGIAVENGDKDMVEVLVNAGADINKPCPATPLMQAVVLTNYDIIATLIRLHADVNAGSEYDSQEYFSPANSSGQISRDGGTPLYLAALEGNIKIVEFLLDWKADVNGLSKKDGADVGKTALHAAACTGAKNIVKLLLSCPGIEVNKGDIVDGETPLDALILFASDLADSDTKSIVNSLLQAGADVWGHKDKGLTYRRSKEYFPLAILMRKQMLWEINEVQVRLNRRKTFVYA